jgi:hypothetical protein
VPLRGGDRRVGGGAPRCGTFDKTTGGGEKEKKGKKKIGQGAAKIHELVCIESICSQIWILQYI